MVAIGEGWHNYHHVFPWDYKAAEFGNYKFNITTMVLDFFYLIGLVYEPKMASPALVKSIAQKHGDGSRTFENSDHNQSAEFPKRPSHKENS